MPTRMIEVEKLVKTYGFRRTRLAVDNVSFMVPKGARFGLLGADGAGKSTVLRILATVLRPTSGAVRVGGHDVDEARIEARKLIGFVPQNLDLSGWRTGTAYLRFWMRASGLPPGEGQVRIDEIVEFLGLASDIGSEPVLSTFDVQKRLNVAQGLLTRPEVLLLDEPLKGLAEAGRQFLLERLERLATDGKTIVLTSPLLADVRAACDRVAVMSEGHVTQVFGVDELLAKIGEGKDARVFVDGDLLSPDAMAAVKGLKGVVDVRSATTATIVYVRPGEVDLEAIRKTLEDHGAHIRGIRVAQLRLGDVFSALNA